MNRQKPESAFESFRVLGKKAQELLQRTRQELEQRKLEQPAKKSLLPETGAEDQRVTIEVSTWSVAKAGFTLLAVIVGTWLVVQLQEPIILLLLAFFVSAVIDPTVRWMERMRIPRAMAIIIHYVVAILVVIGLLISFIPLIGQQLVEMATIITLKVNAFLLNPEFALPLLSAESNRQLTQLMQAALTDFSLDQLAFALQQFGQNLTTAAENSVRFAAAITGSVVSFFVKTTIVLALACFVQLERESIRSWFRSFFPPRYRAYLDDKSEAIHEKIGQWARGQLLLGLCIGFLVFVGLSIIGIRYAVTLAVLAAVTEFIPYFGPLIAAVPGVLVALTERGSSWALLVAALYYLIQWLENNFLVPMIMKRAVGLSPIAVMLAMLMGVSFPDIIHPVLGILLAVPACTIVSLFLEDWREMRQQHLAKHVTAKR